jgi:SAM-dependent methyltransferase
MKICLTTTLGCSVSEAWNALNDPEVFQQVSRPFLSFRPVRPGVFPAAWVSGESYLVEALALGFLPMGTQEINPRTSEEAMAKTFRDEGRGISGTLGAVNSFQHTMTVSPTGVGPTQLTDELEFRAGALTPLLWVGFRLFWWWRHRAMRKLAASWRSESGASWDARYRTTKMWSGKVNQALEAIASDLTPGRALDVGAGEGGDALWLAGRGWAVTATDISVEGLVRGESRRQETVTQDHLPRSIRWIALDAAREELPSPSEKYDLVLSFFGHFLAPERHALWSAMAAAVAPGGQLVIVGHSILDLQAGLRRPPEDRLFHEAELRKILSPHLAELSVENWPRQQTGHDGLSVEVIDIVAIGKR